MDAIIQRAASLHGALVIPPDKAIAHRAVLIAALAQGTTTIHPWPAADDCQRTLSLIQALGVPVHHTAHGVQIEGRGRDTLLAPHQDLRCGESGTTLRLAAGFLAGQPFTSRLSAGPSLSRRPMQRIVQPLTEMGARIDGIATSSGTSEVSPPLTIHGKRPLRAIRYTLPVASAQVKSAILLAGLFAEGKTMLVEPHPTRDHTERLLRHCGVRVHCEGPTIALEPGGLTSPGTLALPGDFSSAAFFIVAAACVPGSRVSLQQVSLNPSRMGLLQVLRRMGARIRLIDIDDAWEPRGTVEVESSSLRGVTLEPKEVPGVIDELPLLMVAATCAAGTTRLEAVGELRVKETDRISSMMTGLQRLGAHIRLVEPETIEIQGGPLKGGEVESVGDHRTAMSLAVAGLLAQGATVVRGAECVSKSFPEFFTVLLHLAGSSTVKTVDKT